MSQSSVRSFSIPALFSKENALKVLHVVSLFSSCSLVCFFSGFSSFCMPLSSFAISFIVVFLVWPSSPVSLCCLEVS